MPVRPVNVALSIVAQIEDQPPLHPPCSNAVTNTSATNMLLAVGLLVAVHMADVSEHVPPNVPIRCHRIEWTARTAKTILVLQADRRLRFAGASLRSCQCPQSNPAAKHVERDLRRRQLLCQLISLSTEELEHLSSHRHHLFANFSFKVSAAAFITGRR